jgi:hypothetical protein
MPKLQTRATVSQFEAVRLQVRFLAVCPRCGAETSLDRRKPIERGCDHIVAAYPEQMRAVFLAPV